LERREQVVGTDLKVRPAQSEVCLKGRTELKLCPYRVGTKAGLAAGGEAADRAAGAAFSVDQGAAAVGTAMAFHEAPLSYMRSDERIISERTFAVKP
jgi:streptogramin lyase